MSDQILTVSAKCKATDQCLFEGTDLFIDISITNNTKSDVGFPLAYIQNSGPIVKLVDNRTKAESYLKTNLADFELRNKLSVINPGKSLKIEWVITSDELLQFDAKHVDVSAVITVKTLIKVEGEDKLVDFIGSDTLRIVGKN